MLLELNAWRFVGSGHFGLSANIGYGAKSDKDI